MATHEELKKLEAFQKRWEAEEVSIEMATLSGGNQPDVMVVVVRIADGEIVGLYRTVEDAEEALVEVIGIPTCSDCGNPVSSEECEAAHAATTDEDDYLREGAPWRSDAIRAKLDPRFDTCLGCLIPNHKCVADCPCKCHRKAAEASS